MVIQPFQYLCKGLMFVELSGFLSSWSPDPGSSCKDIFFALYTVTKEKAYNGGTFIDNCLVWKLPYSVRIPSCYVLQISTGHYPQWAERKKCQFLYSLQVLGLYFNMLFLRFIFLSSILKVTSTATHPSSTGTDPGQTLWWRGSCRMFICTILKTTMTLGKGCTYIAFFFLSLSYLIMACVRIYKSNFL